MQSFNKIVIVSAGLILIISLVVIGVFVAKSISEDQFPPIISDCPDYWDVNYNANNQVICKNNSSINIGSGKDSCIDYPVEKFKENGSGADDVLCTKYKWSKSCGIIWDGVTNNSKPCN